MRKRKRPDWGQRVYMYRATPTGEPPRAMWDLALKMRDAWNWMAITVEETRAGLEVDHGCPRKDKREPGTKAPRCAICSKAWERCWEEIDRNVGEFGFDGDTRTGLIDRAKAAAKVGALNEHRGLDRVMIWHRWGGGGVPTKALFSAKAERVRIAAIPAEAYAPTPESKNPRAARRMRREGHGIFRVPGTPCRGEGRDIDGCCIAFRADLHRPLPPTAILKRVAWCGKRHPRGHWQWTINITVEEPPVAPRPIKTACGIDIGWRVMEGYIRVGYLHDSAGRNIELRLPLTMNTNATRRHNRREGVRNCPASMFDLFALQSERDKALEILKRDLVAHDSAIGGRQGWGKVRNAGLRRLKRELSDRGEDRNHGVVLIEAWEAEDRRRASLYLATSDRMIARRDWLYGNLAKWIATTYDAVCWEEILAVKDMAEADNQRYALRNAQKYRHFAAIGKLRLTIAHAVTKYGATLVGAPSAQTTTRCSECGESAKASAKLVLECPNGHAWDQDRNAARNILERGISQAGLVGLQGSGLRNKATRRAVEDIKIPGELFAVAVPVHLG